MRHFTRSRKPEIALSIEELRHIARRKLPSFVFEYLEGGAEDEQTLRSNRRIFQDYQFVPRTLVRAGDIDLSTNLFEQPMAFPILIGPTGFNGLFANEGDLCLARAAAAAKVPFVQSIVSNASIEEIAATANLRHWLQLYVFKSNAFMESLVRRAFDAGCEALVVTTDSATFGNREWDRRNYRPNMAPTLRNKIETLLHPRWMMEVLARGIPPFRNLKDILPPGQQDAASAAAWSRKEIDPDLDWDRIAWLRSIWPRKLVLKGILSPQEAAIAEKSGIDAIVLSNHGGRQLDGAVSPMTVLPEIVEARRGEMAILVDSGFRRGADVAKAMALGADGVLIGRATLYGLAAGGERGVSHALTILESEFRRTLALLGRPSVASLDGTCIVKLPGAVPRQEVQ